MILLYLDWVQWKNMDKMSDQLIEILNSEMAIELPKEISLKELKEKLSQHINYLIDTNFQQLVAVLYRVDVSESKLKVLLNESVGEDSGSVIAELIIERQLQKIKFRQKFSNWNKNISDEEKW
jgi:hypothetical protein